MTPILARLAAPYDVVRGAIGYLRFPEQRNALGGPFNGQQHRARIFAELHTTFGFRTIVETGTFRGGTTVLFADIPGVRVYTIESAPWSFGYCWARFLTRSNTAVLFGDSPKLLQGLAGRRLTRPIFFYLDAHWFDDLPLTAELKVIFETWPDAVVMIDDFKVEGDENYGFDDYGGDKRLDIGHIMPGVMENGVRIYFPILSAEKETGARRGCVVILGRAVAPSANFITLRQYRPTF